MDVELRPEDVERLIAMGRKFAREGLTFDDVLLEPAASDVLPSDVSTRDPADAADRARHPDRRGRDGHGHRVAARDRDRPRGRHRRPAPQPADRPSTRGLQAGRGASRGAEQVLSTSSSRSAKRTTSAGSTSPPTSPAPTSTSTTSRSASTTRPRSRATWHPASTSSGLARRATTSSRPSSRSSAARPTRLRAQLKGAPVGYINVRGRDVEKTAIYLDGKVRCERGPCIKAVPQGTHDISVRREPATGPTRPGRHPAEDRDTLRAQLAEQPSRTDAIVADRHRPPPSSASGSWAGSTSARSRGRPPTPRSMPAALRRRIRHDCVSATASCGRSGPTSPTWSGTIGLVDRGLLLRSATRGWRRPARPTSG